MSTSQCAVYQVKETPEYRDVRFRSYEKLRSEGKSVSIENYQQVYIGRIKPGETPADIKTRLQKQRPKNFKNAPRRSVLKRLRKHQQKIASQGKGQPQQQRAVEEEMERKKK